MKVLITGKNGQVGKDLVKSVPKGIELFAFARHELDITSQQALIEKIDEIKPDYIINAAAYTAVDKAETEQENAFQVNAIGAGYLANAAREISARLIHLSTDFVFDGTKSTPYKPDDPVAPLSVYGKSKAEGEKLVRNNYAANSIILRTSWVYSVTGSNFVKTMLNLMKERDELRVVVDQVGSPTWSKGLALTIWAMVTNNIHAGIYHWSDAGVTSWYDFAVAIYEEARAINLVEKQINFIPIPTSKYPTPAQRPYYSVLDSSETNKIWSVQSEHWRTALRKMLVEYQKLITITDELIKR
ncbi:MAG: dTDP-4-dehydrorhamnose reductase [Gammaproteobacteria bacterium]